jgi:prepilin-type N-terminal cleavage/methylation domain-containing protein
MATVDSNNAKGFTLVELSIVVVLIGIIMTMGLKTFTATIDNSLISETKSKQERIKIALVGYLRTNGVLPCPDNSGSAVVATGVAAATCNAAAANGYGVVPWQTLGISRETVVDGWGNYFSYRIANGSPGKNWTAKASASNDFTINELKTPTDALTVQELNADSSTLVDATKKAVVVILSHGKNGFGAKTTKVGARMSADDAGNGEKTNAANGTATFVRRPITDSAAAFNGQYDDFVAYMTPQDLLQPLINEGTLKACTGYCSGSLTSVCSNLVQNCSCDGLGPGLQGTPGATPACSGGATCGICAVQPVTNDCTPAALPAAQIPVGAIPVTCS